MVQEAKDIRKEIIKTAREKRAEEVGDRDGGGGGRQRKETTNGRAEVTQRGGGRCVSAQTPGERARGHPQGGGAGGLGGRPWPLGSAHSFLERNEGSQGEMHRTQTTVTNHCQPSTSRELPPALSLGWGALPSAAPSPDNEQSAPKTTRSFHATYRGPEQGSGDGGFCRQWTRALGWGPPGWGELSSQD